jgi:Tfp pilus assembly protein PilN
MRLGDQTAAGIDISQDRISIVLLKNGKDGLELLKSADAPMPEGAIENGNIADPVLLSKAIRDLKVRNRIRTNHAAVSLYARPVIMQIIDMPKQVPSNIRQFVHSEVRNCVALPSRDIALDFCGISSSKRTADKRVLAVAAESARMVELVRVCSRVGISIETIEPPLLAYLRAISAKRLTDKNGWNVLVAILRGNVLSVCVLRNGALDFIRTKEMSGGSAGSNDLSGSSTLLTAGWLAGELSEVVRFYDIEVPENTDKWEITVLVDTAQTPQDLEGCLKSKIQKEHLQVRMIDCAYVDTPVAGQTLAKDKHPSPVAVGLAIGLLTAKRDDLRVNLVPPQVERAREIRREALIAANTVAALLLIMVLAINGFAFMIERATRNTIDKKNLVLKQDAEMIFEQRQRLDTQLEVLSSRIDRISQISASHRDVNWAEVFDEIRKAIPSSIRITSLSCQDGIKMQIEGQALSNEAVNSFVNLLEKSYKISSVVLLDVRKQEGKDGLITYQLSCKLGMRSPGAPG